MLIVTSLAPNHANVDIQQSAVDSWKKHAECFSFNTTGEAKELREVYKGIRVIETHKTVEGIFGKKLININAFIDFAIEWDNDLFLVNSDIILTGLPELKEDGITIFSRHDYKNDIGINEIFIHGFDAVYIPKQFLPKFPPCIYALGVSWWDFFVPYFAIKNSIPVYYPKEKHLFHKWHETQYSYAEWLRAGEFFKLQFNFAKEFTIPQLATTTMANIQTLFIHI